jgi:uncharacterized membrane protein YcaP (DUF421 family)
MAAPVRGPGGGYGAVAVQTACMFFDGWFGLLRVAIVGPLAYVGLVTLLRISGKRTLSKMNAFDLVVTVAMGSTLATALLSKQVVLLEALLAFSVLIGLQWIVAWIGARSVRFEALIKSQPAILLRDGEALRDALRRERVAEVEILAAARSAGHGDLEDVHAIVLETDGTFSVISHGRDHAPVLQPAMSHGS